MTPSLAIRDKKSKIFLNLTFKKKRQGILFSLDNCQPYQKALPFFADEDLDAWISLTQFIYQSNKNILAGGKWGVDVIIPTVSFNMDYGISPNFMFPQDNGTGVGDILVVPYLQWDPVMGKKGQIFMQRI